MRGNSLFGKRRIAFLLAAIMIFSLAFGSTAALADEGIAGAANHKLYPDYQTFEEARAAAEEFNIRIAEEGDVLMKNKDGALPMNGDEYVSVFGERAAALIGCDETGAFVSDRGKSSTTVSMGLEAAGFHVNPTLDRFYEESGLSGVGKETVAFPGDVRSSLNTYNDAAVVVFARNGTEGSDLALVTSDPAAEDDDHLALYTDENGVAYRHFMMLSSTEEALLEYVLDQNFKRVIIVINSSAPIEMGDWQKDDRIDAIVWIGRPGETGVYALGEILSGAVNPSGGAVDEWYADFTADPTWFNFGIDRQITGSNLNGTTTAALNAEGLSIHTGRAPSGSDSDYNFIDYDEGIYLGYKYYETVYAEMFLSGNEAGAQEWWAENVVYPMGYGLSYTDFSFNVKGLYTDEALENEIESGSVIDAALLSNSEGNAAPYESFYVSVDVTNTGSVAGKKIVQVYVTAPYTEENKANLVEKPFVQLAGYAKTDTIAPGATKNIVVKLNTQDMATWDNTADGGRGCWSLDAGDYVLRVMADSHFDLTTDIADTSDMYDEVRFTLQEQALQKADDFSLCAVSNKFSDDTSAWADIVDGDPSTYVPIYNSLRTNDLMEDGVSGQVLLSRQNFGGYSGSVTAADANSENWLRVLPKVKDAGDRTIKNVTHSVWEYYNNFNLNNASGVIDKETDPWYISDEELVGADGTGGLMAGWTQGVDSGLVYADMCGVTDDDTLFTINGETKTGHEWWELLMNELTWDELCDMVEMGCYATAKCDSIDKVEDNTADTPTNLGGTFQWACNTTISATWNAELAYRQGRMVGSLGILKGYEGWYGTGMDNHRTPFSGRNNEYYSQDGIQGGYIAAAVTKGAEDVGLTTYVKHLAFNDQETNRGGSVQFVWSSEQTLRDILKVFQMSMQEGEATASMSGYARTCGFPNPNNYALMTGIIIDEWDWGGFLVTDGYIGWVNSSELDIMIRAGHQQELFTTPMVEYISGSWDADARGGLGSVRITEGETAGSDYVGAKTGVPGTPTTLADPNTYISHLQYYYTREGAKAILISASDDFVQQNGFAMYEPDPGELDAASFVAVKNLSLALDPADLGDSTVKYAVTGLPSGLTVDANTGAISGTTSESGDFPLTVTYTIDSYITKKATPVLHVGEAFYIAEGSDDLTALTVGMPDVYALIRSDVIENAAYVSASGMAPGLVLNEDGSITGSPTEAGVYNVTITVSAGGSASGEASGSSGEASSDSASGEASGSSGEASGDSGAYTYSIQIVVTE